MSAYACALVAATFQISSATLLFSLPFFLLVGSLAIRIIQLPQILPIHQEQKSSPALLFLLYPGIFEIFFILDEMMKASLLEEETIKEGARREQLRQAELAKNTSLQHRIKKMYSNVRHLPSTLDLSSYKKPLVQFFEETPGEQGVTWQYITSVVVIFIAINGFIFFQRDSIVQSISSLFWTSSTQNSSSPFVGAIAGDQGFFKNLTTFDFLPGKAPTQIPQTPVSQNTPNPVATNDKQSASPTAIPQTSIQAINKTINVALINGTGKASNSSVLERLFEKNGFYVKSLDTTTATTTTIHCRPGQEAYAQKAKDVLLGSYDATIATDLSNAYAYADLKIIVGTK